MDGFEFLHRLRAGAAAHDDRSLLVLLQLLQWRPELAVQQISELVPVEGTDYVGPFPAELQQTTHFAAGIASASKAPDLAAAFLALLTAPATAPLFTANGLEPATK